MKVLLTGSEGQLGRALINSLPDEIDLLSTNRSELDLSKPNDCYDYIINNKPDWVINSGAYTGVDKAEEDHILANIVNSEAPTCFAKALKKTGGKLIQISTDFVFNGKQNKPYMTNQKTDPIGNYGMSKAKAEKSILNILQNSNQAFILRTSWLMGPIGNNFLLTMLRLHSEKENINVIEDQIGCPTTTNSLARACWRVLTLSQNEKFLPSILHWRDAGIASWFDVAVAIGELGVKCGKLKKSAIVNPIPTSQYPTAAKRPHYSVLDCKTTIDNIGIKNNYWRYELEEVIKSLSIKY